MTEIDEAYLRKNFGQIWPRHVGSLTWFLIECRRHFDGDLDLFLVLAVIGDRSFAAKNVPQDLTYEQFDASGTEFVEVERINLQSISDFSGIPRETVRRKVSQLLEKGWIERRASGSFAATSKARTDLAPLTEKSLRYLVSMAKALNDTL
jgi:DNA-binding MarR family transcriptional regulator